MKTISMGEENKICFDNFCKEWGKFGERRELTIMRMIEYIKFQEKISMLPATTALLEEELEEPKEEKTAIVKGTEGGKDVNGNTS